MPVLLKKKSFLAVSLGGVTFACGAPLLRNTKGYGVCSLLRVAFLAAWVAMAVCRWLVVAMQEKRARIEGALRVLRKEKEGVQNQWDLLQDQGERGRIDAEMACVGRQDRESELARKNQELLQCDRERLDFVLRYDEIESLIEQAKRACAVLDRARDQDEREQESVDEETMNVLTAVLQIRNVEASSELAIGTLMTRMKQEKRFFESGIEELKRCIVESEKRPDLVEIPIKRVNEALEGLSRCVHVYDGWIDLLGKGLMRACSESIEVMVDQVLDLLDVGEKDTKKSGQNPDSSGCLGLCITHLMDVRDFIKRGRNDLIVFKLIQITEN